MSTEKTGIGRLLAKIGNFFEGLFDAAAKTYNAQSPEIQAALKDGSAILAIINENVSKAPEFVIELIQKAFPSITREVLLNGLKDVAKGINQAEAIAADNLEDTVKNLQSYFESLEGKFWAGVSELGAKLLAVFFAPTGTKWATISSLMEYVYQKFVKK
jgi:hypothetical protein